MRWSLVSVLCLVMCYRAIHGSPEISNLTSPLERQQITVHIILDSSEEYFWDRPSRCPKRHEVWYDRLPKCAFICENMDKSCIAENDEIVSGCECKFRYARPSIGKACEPVYNCPKKRRCPKNEEFKSGKSCKESCDNSACSTDRRQSRRRCFCKQGYRRHKGVCIPEWECEDSNEQECGLNQKWNSCGSMCRDSCDPGCISAAVCKSGCYCKEGFKNIDGRCQEQSKCPKCKQNEVWSSCGKVCQDLCFLPSDCNANSCKPQCVCADGFKRNSLTGACVPESECVCPETMEYKLGSPCEYECLQKNTECSLGREKGCYCKRGMLLYPGQDECVSSEACEHADAD